MAFFAGIWTTWTGVRKVKEGPITTDLYGFLTTKPNAVVGSVHTKAMPVILTTAEAPGVAARAVGRGEGAAATTAGCDAGCRRTTEAVG